MISSVAFCPQAPVLVPDLAQGAAPELDAVRAACRAALGRAVAAGSRPVLIGGGPAAAAFGPTGWGSLAPFGLPVEAALGPDPDGPATLPPALTVGAWLLRDALGPDATALAVAVTDERNALPDFADDQVALVVLGDGSARRTEKAPGHLDERAAAFDEHVADALRTGNAAALDRARLAELGGEDLLVSGLAAWDAVSRLVAGSSWDAELLHAGAPYGVGYLVAAWTRRE